MKEVLARIEAVLRRVSPGEASRRLVFDKLIIDLDAFELIVDGKRIDTPHSACARSWRASPTSGR